MIYHLLKYQLNNMKVIIIKGGDNAPYHTDLDMSEYYVFTDYKLWKKTCREAHRWSETFSNKVIINNELKYLIQK